MSEEEERRTLTSLLLTIHSHFIVLTRLAHTLSLLTDSAVIIVIMSASMSRQTTVMGPADYQPESAGGLASSPPRFEMNKTSKLKYRERLRRWLKMITQFAKVDNKARALKEGAGHLIYLSCDGIAQDLLDKAEKIGKINLDGDEEDETKIGLIESIIEVIAKDSPTDSVKREVDLLTEIQKCERSANESVREFVGRFNGAVARYVNQTVSLSEYSSRQFAVLMLRNAKLTSDTMNALIFQLTAQAGNEKERTRTITIRADDAAMVIESTKGDSDKDTVEASIKRIERAIDSSVKDDIVMFSIEDASSSLSQVTAELQNESPPFIGAMLGKHSMDERQLSKENIKRMKSMKACHICGRKGHWWRDVPECREKMMSKWDSEKLSSGSGIRSSSYRKPESKGKGMGFRL